MGKSIRNQAKMVARIVELPNAATRLAKLEEQLRVGEARLAELAREEEAIRSSEITEGEVARVRSSFRTLFDSIPPTHQARAMELLLEQVTYDPGKGLGLNLSRNTSKCTTNVRIKVHHLSGVLGYWI
jgi:hypothetical protein